MSASSAEISKEHTLNLTSQPRASAEATVAVVRGPQGVFDPEKPGDRHRSLCREYPGLPRTRDLGGLMLGLLAGAVSCAGLGGHVGLGIR
jgi:hypothetical protein